MKKITENPGFLVWYGLLAVLPLVVTLLVFPSAPDTIPAHYGIHNQVDRWGSKYELFLFPVITMVLALLLPGLSAKGGIKLGEQSETARRSAQRNALRIACGTLVLLNLMNAMMLYTSLHKVTDLSAVGYTRLSAVLLSLMQIVMGNLLPKCKQNYAVGIRLPWTLASETVWYQTHRFSGRLNVAAGIVSLALSLLLPQDAALPAAIGVLLAATAAEIIYSYRAFAKWKASGEK